MLFYRFRNNRSPAISILIAVATLPLVANQAPNFLSEPIKSFVKEKSNVPDIAASIATTLSVPIGFEGIPESSPTQITVSVNHSTLRALLDAIVQANPNYEWSVGDKEEIVNIYPRNKNDRILDAVVPRFRVQDKTRGEALEALTSTQTFALLLRKLNASLHTPVSGPPNALQIGPTISIDLQNASLREILNAIITASHGSGWSAVRYGDHLQYLSLSIGG